MHEGRGDLRALLIAERQAFEGVAPALSEAQPLEQAVDLALRCGGAQPVQLAEVDELFGDLHLGVEPALLRHVAETRAIARGDRLPVERDGARTLREHTENDAHRGGLACAVASDKAGHAATRDAECHVVEHPPVAEAAGDPVQLDHAAS